MLIWVLGQIVNAYTIVIIVYVCMSWIPNKHGIIADIDHALGVICDPYLDLFRKLIPSVGSPQMQIDFSPILAILVLQVAMGLIYWLL